MFALLGFATTEAEPIANGQSANLSAMASMMGGLILVLVIIFVLAYIVRKLNLTPSSHGVMKTVAVTPLGQKEKLVLVELDGQQYLLGVTQQQVNLLDKLDKAVQIEPDSASFASRLKQASTKQS
ncbi:flagellar biosynthetic protein FliO [Shewanella gelidii]|uniref:Flagellar protein n=1 Tax=Shewanella gelidii TaxID=1642821 RepID=A0A917N5Q1_9GAMM|nr:flagellar biosynthetic protein FliO [Shewanella gelidii]MCL1096456.1 flagellar biosynthetic protein FliO [Shewanella gelidii]GGI67490.1 flagellar protein [Shewanella gelidii]